MTDKHHCCCCGAELLMCDECHGSGLMQVDGPMDQETGQVGYTEDCSECRGHGCYAAPQQKAWAALSETAPNKTSGTDMWVYCEGTKQVHSAREIGGKFFSSELSELGIQRITHYMEKLPRPAPPVTP